MLFTLCVSADEAASGSGTDPLVTLSYITSVFKPAVKSELKTEIMAEVDASVDEVKAVCEYEVVHMTKGQTLTASGPVELILRSGECSAVVYLEENVSNGIGLSDLTAGGEVLNGQALTRNHLMLIPRADGRGVTVTSSEAYLMVKGEHSIVS